MKLTDDNFLKSLSDRDINAYKVLYKEYYSSLVVYATGFVEQKEIAEDIVQDLFFFVWDQTVFIQSLASLKAFLYNSVKNRCLNYIKHVSVENKYADYFQSTTDVFADLESEMEEADIYRQLFHAIEGLPPRCREVFELHLAGKRNDEIAEMLKLSIETVKTQKKKAVKYLKARINPTLFAYIVTVILSPK